MESHLTGLRELRFGFFFFPLEHLKTIMYILLFKPAQLFTQVQV